MFFVDAPVRTLFKLDLDMKEVWLTKGSPKWMPFHLIFFKNADWLILPCVSFVEKNKKENLGSELVFGFLRWRMSVYFHNGN